jgi:hypothetical protein
MTQGSFERHTYDQVWRLGVSDNTIVVRQHPGDVVTHCGYAPAPMLT